MERLKNIKRTLNELNDLSYDIEKSFQEFAINNGIKNAEIENIWPKVSFKHRKDCLKGVPQKAYPFISMGWESENSLRRFMGIYILYDDPGIYKLAMEIGANKQYLDTEEPYISFRNEKIWFLDINRGNSIKELEVQVLVEKAYSRISGWDVDDLIEKTPLKTECSL